MSAVFASTLNEGYLLLRKNGILKSWQRRWFVLDDKWLTYYKNHSDVGIKFSKQISREDMLEVVSPDDDRADSALSEFDLSIEMVDGTSCVVRAGSIEERDAWVSALDSLLRAALTPRANISAARRLALSGGNIHSVASDSLRIEDIYEIQEMLGSGVAGEVHRAVHKDTGGVVAIKTISKKKFLVNERSVQTTRREIDIMKRLSSLDTRHPHVVDLYAVIETADNLYIVMEIVEGGELFDYVIDHGPYSEETGKVLFRKLVSTLGFLHSQGIVHRDLKPENILLAGGRDTDIKITDFGLANIMSASAILRSKCGTPVYMAPEMLQNRPYNESVDVWAAGILLYILLSGTLPFYADDPDEFLELVLSSSFSFPEQEWGHLSEEVRDLIRKILVPDPKRRLTVRQILVHPWFSGGASSADAVEIAKRSLEQFHARRKFKGAVLAVKAARRLQNASLLGSMDRADGAVEAPVILAM